MIRYLGGYFQKDKDLKTAVRIYETTFKYQCYMCKQSARCVLVINIKPSAQTQSD